jgi:hypothetical protein
MAGATRHRGSRGSPARNRRRRDNVRLEIVFGTPPP